LFGLSPNPVGDDTLWAAVQNALTTYAGFIDRFLDSAPQTNEVRRAAVLIAAGHWLAERLELPLVLSELGASAGLNLLWDHFALKVGKLHLGPADPVLTLAPAWRGSPPVHADRLVIAERAGVDLNPIDTRDPAQILRLLAYLWPDQHHRLALTRAAIAAAPPLPVRADAIEWLATRLEPRPGRIHLIYTTVAWQYFPPQSQARGAAMIQRAGAWATPDAPLAWLSHEADGHAPGAAVTLRLWPGDKTLDLGRADFHGRWVDWRAPE
jgi:hypothetical protein